MIMAGGTGGHVFPALAVARQLRDGGVDVCWLGTRKGIESELVPAAGGPLAYIDVVGIRGKGRIEQLRGLGRLIKAVWQALRAVHSARVDAALGFGGYAAGPGGVAARLLGKPLVIHEQNAVAGTTNRILARFATRVLTGFPDTLSRGEHCGNPVRGEILALPDPALRMANAPRQPRLLVLGGSLGASVINRCLPEALALIAVGERPQVRHQSGRKHLATTRAAYAAAGVAAQVDDFIGDMASAYGWADLVVCRAGALTVAELTAAGVGALIIPLAGAIDDHQTCNAAWLVANRGAVMLSEANLTVPTLAATLGEILTDRPRMLAMAHSARQLARPDAAQRVAAACTAVIG